MSVKKDVVWKMVSLVVLIVLAMGILFLLDDVYYNKIAEMNAEKIKIVSRYKRIVDGFAIGIILVSVASMFVLVINDKEK